MPKQANILAHTLRTTPLGMLDIEVLDGDRLVGRHFCNSDPFSSYSVMSFSRPNQNISVLFCKNCGFRLEVRDLPQKDFDKFYVDIEKLINEQIDNLVEENIQPGSNSVAGVHFRDGHITLEPGGPKGFRAWHCRTSQGKKQIMRFRPTGKADWIKLYCPECNYNIEFEYAPGTTFEKLVNNLYRVASSRWHD
ncbi:MAG: hypothetical protein HYX21_00430 [Candidatus Yanofskybacteria bacterium]|nr:hypothetical protein [Candidatus Yanofskybacteria bacterium]